jgi:hypothetical protein
LSDKAKHQVHLVIKVIYLFALSRFAARFAVVRASRGAVVVASWASASVTTRCSVSGVFMV